MISVGYRPGTKTYAAVTVPATAGGILISAASGSRMSLAIFNTGSATLYIGSDASVTTSNGYPVPAGTSFTDSVSIDAWYGICATSTLDIRTMTVTST